MAKKSMTPSAEATPISGPQIGKINDKLGIALRQSGIPSVATQQVLETQGEELTKELVAVIRTRVEALASLITRNVPVNRARTPQQALDATGRRQYINQAVVDAMPRTKTEGIEVVEVGFFKPRPCAFVDGIMTDDRLAAEYGYFGLKPDPIAVAAVNEADPDFATKHPNAVHWKDKDGKYCFAAFSRWRGRPSVRVPRFAYDWRDNYVFGGVRK